MTTETGKPVVNEKISLYIYGQETSQTTDSLKSEIVSYTVDTHYWDLIDTLELVTDENGKAITEWTVITDNNVQIVAEYSGNIEGEGGVNIGASTASYIEGETPTQFALGLDPSLYFFGAIGAAVSVAIFGVFVILKRRKVI